MLGRLNDAGVMVHRQGVGKLVKGMEHLPSGVMQVCGFGCVPDRN